MIAVQGLLEATSDGVSGSVEWSGNWMAFADAAMHLALLALPLRALLVPAGFDSVRVEPRVLLEAVERRRVAERAAAGAGVLDGVQEDLLKKVGYLL